ncbi:MAG: STAS domain-containing protein [Pseudomonadota bacterium]
MTSSNASNLTIDCQDFADCKVVKVAGRVDHTTSDQFLEDIGAHANTVNSNGGMVIELSGLEFITSAGLRALLLAQRTVHGTGGKLVVSGIRGVVKEVFRISKFDALLSVSESTSEAVGQISAAAAEAFSG